MQNPITPTLSLATVNAPDECAVAGPRDEILALAETLEAEGTPGSVIPIDVAAHSSVLDPILPSKYHSVRVDVLGSAMVKDAEAVLEKKDVPRITRLHYNDFINLLSQQKVKEDKEL